MTIKYIALSGGGPSSCISYSIMRELEKKNFWKLNNIQAFYASSSGVYMSILLSLGYNWDWMDEFIIKRPWQEVGEINSEIFVDYVNKSGFLDCEWTRKLLSPLLEGKGLKSDATMKDLYEFTKKNLYVYVTNVKRDFEKIVITHESYPDLPVYKALHMSMTLPGIFIPICDEKGIYVDGGFLNHYPIIDLVKDNNIENEEVLGINLLSSKEKYEINPQNNSVKLYKIIGNMILKMINHSNDQNTLFEEILKYDIRPSVDGFNTLSDWYNCMYSQEKRIEMLDIGTETANKFLTKLSFTDK